MPESGIAGLFQSGADALAALSPVERSIRNLRSYAEGEVIPSPYNQAREDLWDTEREGAAKQPYNDDLLGDLDALKKYEREDPIYPRIMHPRDLLNWPRASIATGYKLIPVDHDPFAPTVLKPGDEARFRADMESAPAYKAWADSFRMRFGNSPNLNDPQYDYRGAWKAGVMPAPYSLDGGFPHWPSALPSGQMLKAPDHPTAWMEHFQKQFGIDPNLASSQLIERARGVGIVPQDWSFDPRSYIEPPGLTLIPVDHDPFGGPQ